VRDEWSDFSESDVEIEEAILFDINASIRMAAWRDVSLYALVGYRFNRWEWTDFGRRFEYSSDPDAPSPTEALGWRDVDGDFGGVNGIDYEQRFGVPYAGVGATLCRGGFSGSLYLVASGMVSAEDHDDHILRDLRFDGEFTGGAFIAAGADGTLELGDALFAGVSLDAQFIPEFKGDMTVTESDGTQATYHNAAGIENTVLVAGVTVGARF
jgi:outer membrane protease